MSYNCVVKRVEICDKAVYVVVNSLGSNNRGGAEIIVLYEID